MNSEALDFSQFARVDFDGRKTDDLSSPASDEGMLEQMNQLIAGSGQKKFLIDEGLQKIVYCPNVFAVGIGKMDIGGLRCFFHSAAAPVLNHLLVKFRAPVELFQGNPFIVGVGLFHSARATDDFFLQFIEQSTVGCIANRARRWAMCELAGRTDKGSIGSDPKRLARADDLEIKVVLLCCRGNAIEQWLQVDTRHRPGVNGACAFAGGDVQRGSIVADANVPGEGRRVKIGVVPARV